jgi:hypothetical protein
VPVKVLVRRRLFVEPGLYRLQKASEQAGAEACPAGLLRDLGVPVSEEVKVSLAK